MTRVLAYAKVLDLSGGYDLSKCPRFHSFNALDDYLKDIYPNYYVHFNGFDSRCNLIQYIVCVDDHAVGYLWFGLEVKK